MIYLRLLLPLAPLASYRNTKILMLHVREISPCKYPLVSTTGSSLLCWASVNLNRALCTHTPHQSVLLLSLVFVMVDILLLPQTYTGTEEITVLQL